METTIFVPPSYRKFLELATSATKIYTTTALVFFCIICLIIADHYKNIGLQMHNLPLNSTKEDLKGLQLQVSVGRKKHF